MQNQCTPFWLHPLLKPLSSTGDTEAGPSRLLDQEGNGDKNGNGNDKAQVGKYKQLNLARVTMNNPSSDDEQGGNQDKDRDEEEETELVNLGESKDSSGKKTCREEMASHICTLQDFCDGIKYQIQFQDQHFLKMLEREGSRFFRLAQNCLSQERQLNLSWVAPQQHGKGKQAMPFSIAQPRDNHST